ncbi:hypothetical protein V8V91_21600 [Algoriphagus halophilus]|uniref:hypothetical protein n=1 Tax=Algoriphagus halophilus TaxID=226505 RepID=UPI00358FD81E
MFLEILSQNTLFQNLKVSVLFVLAAPTPMKGIAPAPVTSGSIPFHFSMALSS